jgi:hypothetical protein
MLDRRFYIGFFSFGVPLGARKTRVALRGLLVINAFAIRLTICPKQQSLCSSAS